MRSVTIAKRRFELDRDGVERAMAPVLPEPIASHYVVIGERRYPPKQVIGHVTDIDRADFTSHQARRILMGLGFAVGRRQPAMPGSLRALSTEQTPQPSRESLARDRRRRLAEELRSFRGQWVAVRSDELLVAAPTAKQLIAWLAQHGQRADSMFRVPEDDRAMSGMAPL